jgi:cytochrome c oxidase assembly protein subunit 15
MTLGGFKQIFWWEYSAPTARVESNLMLAALALQVALGISTLLSVVALPLAAAHQAGAVLLYAACLWTAHALTIERPAVPRIASGPDVPADSRLLACRP